MVSLMSEVSLYSCIALLLKYTSYEVEFSLSTYIVLSFKGKNNASFTPCLYFKALHVFTSKRKCVYKLPLDMHSGI